VRGFLVDTCAISEFTKPAPDLGLVSWLAQTDSNLTYLSAVTVGELRFGIAIQSVRKKRERLENWLRSEVLSEYEGRILPFDEDVAQRWGRLRSEARKTGTSVPVIDAMIAATAIHYNLAIVSRNETDFRRMGLDIVNPWSG
jgi:predicted nucleic acid-binding protein